MTGQRIRRRPDVLWRRSLDAVVLLSVGEEDVLTLGGTGPAIWQLLAEWRTLDDLATVLAQAFKSDQAVVEGDLRVLVTELHAHNVLETAADSGGSGPE